MVADSLGNFWVVSVLKSGAGCLKEYSNTGEVLVDSQVFHSDDVVFGPVVIAFYDGRNISGSDLIGQRTTAPEELNGVPFMVNTTVVANRIKPAVLNLDSGGCGFVWRSLLQDGDLAGNYAQSSIH